MSPLGWFEKRLDRARRWSGRGGDGQRSRTRGGMSNPSHRSYRKVLFEALEPRLLLSADPFPFTALSASEYTLKVNGSDLELTDDLDGDTRVAHQVTSDATPISITGSSGADKFTIDFTTPFTQEVTIDGAGGTDTLTGDDVANNWSITGTDSGTLNGGGFSNIENLTGGSAADDFILAGGTLSGAIDGGGGSDTLTGDNVANAWVLTTANAGTVTGIGDGFSNIGNLIGGTGSDTLTGEDVANSWSITGTDSGTLNGIGFSDFENLTGGAAEDDFILAGGTLSGAIDGGGGSDTLTGDNVANAWVLTTANAGTLNGDDFSGIEALTGGTDADSFDLGNAGSLTGILFGGAGIDTLDYATAASAIASISAPDWPPGLAAAARARSATSRISSAVWSPIHSPAIAAPTC